MKRHCIWGGTPSAFSSVLLIRYWGRVDEFRVYKQTRFNYGHTCVAHDDSCWTVNVWTNWCIDRLATDAMYTDARRAHRKYMCFSIYISVIWNYNYTRDGGKNRIRSFQMGHHIGIKIEKIRRNSFTNRL